MIETSDSLVRLISVMIGFGGYSYLLLRQLNKVRGARDVITPLRIIMMIIFALAWLTFIPSIISNWLIVVDSPSSEWRKLSLYMSSLNQLATMALIIVFVNYPIKADES